MNWKSYWNEKANKNSSLAQVGREDDAEKFALTLQHLEELISPHPKMVMYDICCGNGLITKHFAPKVAAIIGIDISEKLLDNAKRNNQEFQNVSFYCSAAQHINEMKMKNADVVLMHFSFQYFTSISEAKKVLQALKDVLNPNGKIIITDIPNHYKAHVFFPGIIGLFRYLKQRYFKSGEMGRFWKPNSICKIANQIGMQANILAQDSNLPYSHYRFDVIIKIIN